MSLRVTSCSSANSSASYKHIFSAMSVPSGTLYVLKVQMLPIKASLLIENSKVDVFIRHAEFSGSLLAFLIIRKPHDKGFHLKPLHE